MTKPDGDSAIQSGLETKLIEGLAGRLKVDLIKKDYKFDDCSIQLDGFAQEGKSVWAAEAYARTSDLNSGSKRKLLTDALKLRFFADRISVNNDKEVKLFLVVASKNVKQELEGDSWAAKALKDFGIGVEVIELDQQDKRELNIAVNSQRKGNAAKSE